MRGAAILIMDFNIGNLTVGKGVGARFDISMRRVLSTSHYHPEHRFEEGNIS